MQIQISWLLKKPTDLFLHCLQRQDMSSAGQGLTTYHGSLKFEQVYFYMLVFQKVPDAPQSVDHDQTPHFVASDLIYIVWLDLAVQIFR